MPNKNILMTPRQQAVKCRRSSRRSRIAANVFFTFAGVFVVLGIVFLLLGSMTGLTILASAAICASSAFSLRLSAASFADTASSWERRAGVA